MSTEGMTTTILGHELLTALQQDGADDGRYVHGAHTLDFVRRTSEHITELSTEITLTKAEWDRANHMVYQLRTALEAALKLAQGYIEAEYPESMWPEKMHSIEKLRTQFNIPKD